MFYYNLPDYEANDAPNKLVKAERELKDRIRKESHLATRKNINVESVDQHAKNNGISPSYELPVENSRNKQNSHYDRNIQTLLLPDFFEKRLVGLYSKYRTWSQETEINVLHVVFGFVKWGKEAKSTK